MKPILKLFLLTIATGACVLPTVRADETNPNPADNPPAERREKFRHHMKEGGERMAKELGLTADQQTRMKALGEEQKKAADAIRADASLTPDQKKEKVKQIREDFKARRQALLTPEQQKKAEEMKTKFKERRHSHDEEAGAEVK